MPNFKQKLNGLLFALLFCTSAAAETSPLFNQIRHIAESAHEQETQGKYTEAKKTYEQGLKSFPNQPYLLARLAHLHWQGLGGATDIKLAQDLIFLSLSNGGHSIPITQYYYANIAEQNGSLHFAARIKAASAMGGYAPAFDDLPDLLRRLLLQISSPDKPAVTWQQSMLSIEAAYLDYQVASESPLLWAVAFEHGIGVPQNQICAQALYLFLRRGLESVPDSEKNEYTNWLITDLSTEQNQAARELFEQIWAIAKPIPQPIPASLGWPAESQNVLNALLQYAQQHPQITKP